MRMYICFCKFEALLGTKLIYVPTKKQWRKLKLEHLKELSNIKKRIMGHSKIYISGKMNGDSNFSLKFDYAEKYCITSVDFTDIINPASLVRLPTWKESLKRDLKILNDCDAIFMIKGWEDSRGATLEHWYAKRLGLEIFYQI